MDFWTLSALGRTFDLSVIPFQCLQDMGVELDKQFLKGKLSHPLQRNYCIELSI